MDHRKWSTNHQMNTILQRKMGKICVPYGKSEIWVE